MKEFKGLGVTRVYLVCRHKGAIEWVPNNIPGGYAVTDIVSHVDDNFISNICNGDIVVGILPVDIIAKVNEKGAKFYNLSLDIPKDMRGQELSAEQMQKMNARLERFHVIDEERYAKKDEHDYRTNKLIFDLERQIKELKELKELKEQNNKKGFFARLFFGGAR